MSSNTTSVDTSIFDKMEYEVFIQAIHNIASVRPHDESILITAQESNDLAFWAICISIAVAIVTIFATIYIYRRQESIIRDQLKLSEQQNKIALFEKRYTSYFTLSEIKQNCTIVFDHIDSLYNQTIEKAPKGIIYHVFCFAAMKTFLPKEIIDQVNRKFKAEGDEQFFEELIVMINKRADEIEKVMYLFELDESEKCFFKNMACKMRNFYLAETTNLNPIALKTYFTELVTLIREKDIEYMQKQLQIASLESFSKDAV